MVAVTVRVNKNFAAATAAGSNLLPFTTNPVSIICTFNLHDYLGALKSSSYPKASLVME